MPKRLVSVVAFALLAAPALARAEAPLAKGQVAFNGGLGLERAPIPLYAGLDVAVHPDVTLGGDLFVSTGNYGLGALGRGDYHWNRLLGIPRAFDFYLGAGVWFSDYGLYPRLQLGGRWFFTESVGLNLEFGGSRFVGGMLGVTVKLNK